MGKTPLITDLELKTKKLMGTDISYFLCREKEILSVENLQIFIDQEPKSSEKQRIPFNGIVYLRFKQTDGGYTEGNYRFSGVIEVDNFSNIINVIDKPFVIH